MLHKRNNSVVTLAVLLTLVGVSEPAKADLLAQSNTAPNTFTAPDKLPKDATLNIAESSSIQGFVNSLKESFTTQYPEAKVNIKAQDSTAALKNLSEGKVDLAAIGRSLTPAEKAQGLIEVPVSREKIAIVISQNNPFEGNLTIDQFAQIFRGEITDWSQIGGAPGKIQLVDSPETNDTRQAFPNYPVFQSAEFKAGSNANKLKRDGVDGMIAKLGANGIGYAVANDVINRDDVKVVTMHQTQPDDPRYPFSQPFNLIYQGTPSEAAKAYMGFATTEGGQKVISSRVGSLSTAAVSAVAAKVGSDLVNKNKPASSNNANTAPVAKVDGATKTADAGVDGKNNTSDPTTAKVTNPAKDGAQKTADAGVDGVDKNAIANDVNQDVKKSGELNPDVQNSGEANPDVQNSGAVNPDVQGSGELNPDVKNSGEVNPDVQGSGELNPDVQNSGEPLSSTSEVETKGAEVAPNGQADVDPGTKVATKKGKWWLWLLPLLALPLLLFGRRKKSDQEPALGDDLPNINGPDGRIGIPEGSGGIDVPPVGANVSGGLNSVAENSLNTNSGIGTAGLAAGGAALAGGAAAAANLANRRNRTENVTDRDRDLDLDLDLEESTSVEEIPSNPVSEFTGQETKLQPDGQGTDLQVESNLDDFDSRNLGDLSVAGGAVLGGAALNSRFSNNESIVVPESETPPLDDVDLDTSISGLSTEQTTDLSELDLDNTVNTVETSSTTSDLNSGREFTGDFVLQEETREIPVIDEVVNDIEPNFGEIATPELAPNVEGKGIIDNVTQAGGAAIAGGAAALGGAAAAASGMFNRGDSSTEDLTVDLPDSDQNTDLDADLNLGDRLNQGVTNFTDLSGDVTTPEVPNLDVDPNVEGRGIIDNVTQAGGAAIAGGAAALGGAAAAASGMFNRGDSTTEDLTVDLPDSNQNTDLDADLNLGDRQAIDNFGNFQEFETFETSLDLSEENTPTNFADNVIADAETTSIDRSDYSAGMNLDNFTPDTADTTIEGSLEEITFDDVSTTSNFSMDDITIDASLEEINFDASQRTSEEQDVDLDDLGFEELVKTNKAETSNNLADDQSNDLNNISEWLDSLETPNQDRDNISEWLDSLDKDSLSLDANSEQKNINQESNLDLEDDGGVSFQFLEDLLDRDSGKPNNNPQDQ